MYGDKIFARTVSANSLNDRHGNKWQYHSRSDAHSKAACWGILFDLLQHCQLLAQHVHEAKVGFGINHEMRDFRQNRKKNLDLVICTPSSEGFEELLFHDLVAKYSISLSQEEEAILDKLPRIRRCPVGSVLIALEAKACMTEHIKARPRLYDELSSSYQTILGDTNQAIAAAFVSINVGKEFISPDKNKCDLTKNIPQVNEHRQPYVAQKVLEKVKELPRRSHPDDAGFDAVGVVLVDCRNDGTEIRLMPDFGEGTGINGIVSYTTLVERISNIYSTRFRSL